MNESSLVFRLAVVEGVNLAELIQQFLSVLSDSDNTSDPAVQRLVPNAYPDDEDASAEFSDATRDDLIDRRRADAAVVLHALAPLLSTAPEDLSGKAALDEYDVAIRADDLDAWLRTLASLRLVIATRLGITSDDEHHPEEPRYSVYDWLGYR